MLAVQQQGQTVAKPDTTVSISTVSSCSSGNRTRRAKTKSFPNADQVVLCRNLTRPKAHHCQINVSVAQRIVSFQHDSGD